MGVVLELEEMTSCFVECEKECQNPDCFLSCDNRSWEETDFEDESSSTAIFDDDLEGVFYSYEHAE